MGNLGEFPFSTRMRLKAYRWRRIDPVPWTPLQRPLAQCRLALVSSAGFVLPEQERFGESRRGANPGFREIPAGVDVSTLVHTHASKAFDHTALRRDPNLAFPKEKSSFGDAGVVDTTSRSRAAISLARVRRCAVAVATW